MTDVCQNSVTDVYQAVRTAAYHTPLCYRCVVADDRISVCV
jgi:hypothetical protein